MGCTTPAYAYTPEAAGVRVRVFGLQAQGLRSADRNGLSDPFAVLVVGRERHETEVVPKTLDPVWTVRGDCEFGRDENLELHDGIRVKLYDKDAFGKDKLGEVFLPFDDLWDNNGAVLSAWRPVVYQGSERGRCVVVAVIFV
jgi:Ca2+-dependent lipid-binding protein